MSKTKRVKLWLMFLSITLLIVGLNSADAQDTAPNSEKGDALFRHLRIIKTVGHAAIYLNSDSKFAQEYPWTSPLVDVNKFPIKDSDSKHSVIEASGHWTRLGIKTFEYFLDGKDYWGAYNSGALDYYDRRKLDKIAWDQRGCRYEFLEWPWIKMPASEPGKGDGSFRCDGLVEYCYEGIGVNGNIGFFTNEEEQDCFGTTPTFYPRTLMLRMEDMAGGQAIVTPPEVRITDPDPNEEMKIISGTYTLKAFASDGENGSGIDKVEFWVGEPDDTPDEVPGLLLGIDDHDTSFDKPEEKHIYKCDWNTTEKDANGDPLFPDGEYTIYAKAFDQAGNTKVSEGVLVKVENISWTVMYEANELPDEASPVWGRVGGSANKSSISGSILTIETFGHSLYYSRQGDLASNSAGNTVVARARYISGQDVYLLIWDKIRFATFELRDNFVRGFGENGFKYYYMDVNAFHIYRLTLKNDKYQIYVDGVKRIEDTAGTDGKEQSRIDFGQDATAESQWDYVRGYAGGF